MILLVSAHTSFWVRGARNEQLKLHGAGEGYREAAEGRGGVVETPCLGCNHGYRHICRPAELSRLSPQWMQ